MTFGEARFVQWWVRLLGAIVLLLLVFLVYARVGAAGFIWDDESHLTQNPCIVGPLGLGDIWTSASAFYYPLVLTTFWILHHFVGLNPLPYHILNVTFHGASALLLWRVLVQLRVRIQAARPAFIAPFRSNFAAGERMDNLGTEISLPRYRSGLGADTSSACSYFSRCHLVLSTQAHLAASADFHLPALER